MNSKEDRDTQHATYQHKPEPFLVFKKKDTEHDGVHWCALRIEVCLVLVR